MRGAPVAAIDCGTNSIRLLIAEHRNETLVDLDRRMIAVRLGEGVDQSGHLAPAALERTFAACRQYGEVIRNLGAQRVRFVATSASRDADNAAEFRHGVSEILGVMPQVISGAEEAQLSFAGATAGQEFETPALVFDIGGGSTEFVLGYDSPEHSMSVDMGCVRFMERYVRHDPMTAAEHAAITQTCDQILERVGDQVPFAQAATVFGLAGTVTTVAALALALPAYDAAIIQGAEIPTTAIQKVAQDLRSMTSQQRAELAVMHPGRADVVAVGAVILERIMAKVGAASLIASEHDILDGIAWSLVAD